LTDKVGNTQTFHFLTGVLQPSLLYNSFPSHTLACIPYFLRYWLSDSKKKKLFSI